VDARQISDELRAKLDEVAGWPHVCRCDDDPNCVTCQVETPLHWALEHAERGDWRKAYLFAEQADGRILDARLRPVLDAMLELEPTETGEAVYECGLTAEQHRELLSDEMTRRGGGFRLLGGGARRRLAQCTGCSSNFVYEVA
jgi:hypothetical protein